jgi:threonine/homoserine/homoserine lactone efflux protein
MIELTQILTYATALSIAVALPGPGITALVARSANSGSAAGFSMLLGFIAGDMIYLSFAVFGLVLVAQSFAMVFVVIKWFSVLYLLYLAWNFWHAEHHDMTARLMSGKDLISTAFTGLFLTLGNPKPIAFYLALLPVVLDLEKVTFSVYLTVLVPLTIFVLATVGSAYIMAALSLRRALNKNTAQQKLHRGAAIAMAAAAGSIVVREM